MEILMICHLLKEGQKQESRPTSHEVSSFEKLFGQPKTYSEKSKIPHWNISEYIQPLVIPCDLTLSPRKIHNLGLESTKYLVLDYDTNSNINETLEHFSKYRLWFHTSFNHTIEIPKFRVILELDKNISNDEFKLIRNPEYYNLFKQYFYNVDLSCFSTKRFFAIPALKVGFEKDYQWKIQDGLLFPYDDLRYYINICRKTEQEKFNKLVNIEKKNTGQSVEKKLAQLTKNILKFDINNRGGSRGTNAKIYGYVQAAKKITGSLDEARKFVMDLAQHPDTKEAIKNIKN